MSNYGSYNVKLAQILGLTSAVYLSQLMDINEKAIRKDKVNDNYFTVDRDYIKTRTTLSHDEQKTIENKLIKIGILQRSESDSNTILLDITVLTSIMMSPDESLVKEITAFSKKRRTKEQVIKETLKESIVTTNSELRTAYEGWIDAVYEKDGFMTKQAVISAQRVVDDFSKRDLDIALKLLEIASINGYRDITWAINNYKKDFMSKNVSHPSCSLTLTTSTKVESAPPVRKRLSDEVF